MSEAHRTLPGPWEEGDVARIVNALRRSGPLPIRDLPREPEFAGWAIQRIEHAVISAWSRNLIFIDQGDQLVAL
jgi:hypothetical protein